MVDDYKRMVVFHAAVLGLALGVADAAVVATAERLTTAEIATVDRRHFEHIRPVHVAYSTIYPALEQ